MDEKTLRMRLDRAERGLSVATLLLQDLLEITHRTAPQELERIIRRRRLHIQGHTSGRLPMKMAGSLPVFEESLRRLETAANG